MSDGRVEVVAEGPKDELTALLRQLYRGPTYAEVEAIDVTWGERAALKGFKATEAMSTDAVSTDAVSTNIGSTSADYEVPEPLPLTEAERVPGVLGRISAGRVLAYQSAPLSLELEHDARPGFAEALRAPGMSIIAEVKRKSPSLGDIAELDPRTAALAYAAGGAAALSVLTEPDYFGGELTHLSQVAGPSLYPLFARTLRFTRRSSSRPRSPERARFLLIVAVLGERTESYLRLAQQLGLDALVEVHDEAELELALSTRAEIIGVNNRDLKRFISTSRRAPRLLRRARGRWFRGLAHRRVGVPGGGRAGGRCAILQTLC